MSYMNYVHLMTDFLKYRSKRTNKKLRILEIGVDRGQTSVPLVSNLGQTDLDWQVTGVDIREDLSFQAQLLALECVKAYGVNIMETMGDNWNYRYLCMDSCDFLYQINESNKQSDDPIIYDLVLLDSDHNYESTFSELGLLIELIHNESLIIVDDFHGRHSDNDVFYADYDSHKHIKHKKLKRNAPIQGVNNAVIDFCRANPGLDIIDLGGIANGEPIAIAKDTLHVQCHNATIGIIDSDLNVVSTHILHRACQEWEFSNKLLYDQPYPARWKLSSNSAQQL